MIAGNILTVGGGGRFQMGSKDRLIPLVWITFVPLAMLTAIFGPLLLVFPGSTSTFWAWQIKPDMSAVWLGAAYTFGALALTTMLRVGSWRAAVVPVIATWSFSIVMLAATLIHLDRFFLGTVNFYVWLAIYILLPVVLPLIWWLNRGQDHGPQPGDMPVPARFSIVAGSVGIILSLASLLMILDPATAARFWPWQLTPLMSRVIGGWVVFASVGLVCLFFERRYIAYRYFLPVAGVWMAILFSASWFHLGDFNPARAATWIWFALVGGLAVTLFMVSASMEARLRRQREIALVAAPETLQSGEPL
jgi:hypothetical protein